MNKINIDILFAQLNQKYFNNTLACELIWGRAVTQRVRTRRLGSYHLKKNKITLSPLLKDPQVPFFVLAAILYHEMCHAHVPPRREKSRMVAHGPDFKKKEREFEFFQEAKKWVKSNREFLFSKRKNESVI